VDDVHQSTDEHALSPPPLHGVIETSLYVDDVARAVEFYRRVFGFEIVDSGERLAAMGVADRQLLLLFKKGASASLPLSPHDGDGQLHLAFAIPAASVAAWRGWLAELGIEIVEERQWERGGVSLYFRDPDGHLLEVATPGVWPRVY
jgi:catechol 2,3-dioxygenase-like lactoylglutathione lyase family enzyme